MEERAEQGSAPTDPLERHRAQADEVLAGGDPAAIKQLYVELGQDLEAALATRLDDVPVLSFPETFPAVVPRLECVRGRILDAGCGPHPGASLTLAASAARTVVVLDIGLGTVRLARSLGEARGVGLLGVVGDVERLPFRDGAFDGILCDDTVEHLPDDRTGVAELVRVLARSGRLVLATPNRHSLDVLRRKATDRVRGKTQPASYYFSSNSHLREYTWREFEQLLPPAGRVLARVGVGWAGGWKKRLASALVSRPPFRRFSQMVVVEVARR